MARIFCQWTVVICFLLRTIPVSSFTNPNSIHKFSLSITRQPMTICRVFTKPWHSLSRIDVMTPLFFRTRNKTTEHHRVPRNFRLCWKACYFKTIMQSASSKVLLIDKSWFWILISASIFSAFTAELLMRRMSAFNRKNSSMISNIYRP